MDIFATKTFWTGMAMVGFGIFTAATGDVNQGVELILEGLGIITLRHGIAKL